MSPVLEPNNPRFGRLFAYDNAIYGPDDYKRGSGKSYSYTVSHRIAPGSTTNRPRSSFNGFNAFTN